MDGDHTVSCARVRCVLVTSVQTIQFLVTNYGVFLDFDHDDWFGHGFIDCPVSNNSFGSFWFSTVLVGHGFIICLVSESFVVSFS